LNNKNIIGVILVLFTSFGYGTMPAVTQRAFSAGLSVETILASRFTLAVLILWIYLIIKKYPYKLDKKHILFLLLLGILIVSVSTFLNESYKYVPGAISSLIVSLYVVFVLIIEIIIGREKIIITKIFCVLLASIGLIIIMLPKDGIFFSPVGILFACIAGISYAFFVLGLGEKRTKNVMSEIVTSYTLLPSAVINILRCFLTEQPIIPESFSQWIYIIYLSFVSTFFAGVCFCKAVKYIGSSNAALINTIEPFIAYLAGIILMSDIISLKAIIGSIFIIVSIVYLNLSERKIKNNSCDIYPLK
jgi:drug/metabolite transporter (DMT)-like permease